MLGVPDDRDLGVMVDRVDVIGQLPHVLDLQIYDPRERRIVGAAPIALLAAGRGARAAVGRAAPPPRRRGAFCCSASSGSAIC